MSAAMLSEMLAQGPDAFMEIDTVGDAARWGIDVAGIAPIFNPSPRDLTQACINIEAWAADQPAEPLSSDSPYLDWAAIQPADFGEGFYHLDTGGMEERGCYIAARPDGPRAFFEICTRDDFNVLNLGNCPQRGLIFPTYYALPPQTRLADLPAG
jgi:hypothetical protein